MLGQPSSRKSHTIPTRSGGWPASCRSPNGCISAGNAALLAITIRTYDFRRDQRVGCGSAGAKDRFQFRNMPLQCKPLAELEGSPAQSGIVVIVGKRPRDGIGE